MKPIIDMDESNFEIEQQLDGIKMKIGFIGLGIMGSRMAANLQKRNYSLVVFNRTRDKAELLLDRGATLADSSPKLAEQVDVLFTMLAHPDAVEQAALGGNGFLSHLKPNTIWIDCSSVNPSFSKRMATAMGNLLFGLGVMPPTWTQFAHCCCAWATKLFMSAAMGRARP